MEYISLFWIFVIGTMFGSFASVLIPRIKSGEGGIFGGRSYCDNCKHKLSFFDLFPIFSYLFSGGKCRYCKTHISLFYPILEIVCGILFLIGFSFIANFDLILAGNIHHLLQIFSYLTIFYICFLFTFYDLKYLEISDRMMGFGILFISIILFYMTISGDNSFILNYADLVYSSENIVFGIVYFGVLLSLMYTIIFTELKPLYDFGLLAIGIIFSVILSFYFPEILKLPISDGIFGSFILFTFFYFLIFFSNGRALGGGDLRIAIFLGLCVSLSSMPFAFFVTYLSGSLIGIIVLIFSKYVLKKEDANVIPFGPFLAIGIILSLLFPYISFESLMGIYDKVLFGY